MNPLCSRTIAPFWIGSVAIICLFLSRELWHAVGPNIILNMTSSIPKGYYLVRPLAKPARDSLVIFPLPKKVLAQIGTRPWLNSELPLIKPIAALSGDTVCVTADTVIINGTPMGRVYQSDFQGVALPHVRGCFTVPDEYFFPLSHYSDRSFDGRYFGALPLSNITGQAIPLFTW